MPVVNIENRDHLHSKMFLDERGGVAVARYDMLKYKRIDKMTEEMNSQFWVPEEVSLAKDKIDFGKLPDAEKHIFTSNLKRQTMLDTIQGRALSILFLAISSLPEIEPLIDSIQFFESIHSRSYTHIIRNLYNNPSEVFDQMLDIEEIQELSHDIGKYYNELHRWNCMLEVKDMLPEGTYNLYDHKKALYLALITWNALEAVRFYVSFACSFAFGERAIMEGNAKIIKLIARDEEWHCLASTFILNHLEQDDEDFIKIKEELAGTAAQIFIDTCQQEKDWAEYLFKDGSMIGLNKGILEEFCEWRTHKRMKAVGLDSPFSVANNPIPWISSWLNSSGVQTAPQETEITSYLIGIIKPDTHEVPVENLFDLDRALKLA